MNAKDLLGTLKVRSVVKLFNDNNLPDMNHVENETINLPKHIVIDFSNDYKMKNSRMKFVLLTLLLFQIFRKKQKNSSI